MQKNAKKNFWEVVGRLSGVFWEVLSQNEMFMHQPLLLLFYLFGRNGRLKVKSLKAEEYR